MKKIMEVTIEVEIDDDEKPTAVTDSIESNLRDCMGHCPYDAQIIKVMTFDEDD